MTSWADTCANVGDSAAATFGPDANAHFVSADGNMELDFVLVLESRDLTDQFNEGNETHLMESITFSDPARAIPAGPIGGKVTFENIAYTIRSEAGSTQAYGRFTASKDTISETGKRRQ